MIIIITIIILMLEPVSSRNVDSWITPLYLCPPETGWSSCTPGQWVSILVASNHKHGLLWGYYYSRTRHGNALIDRKCVCFEPTPICSRKLGACHGLTRPTLRVKSDRLYKSFCSDSHINITTYGKSLSVPFYYAQKFTFTYLLTHYMEQSPSWEANRSSVGQEIPYIFMETEGPLPHSQVPARHLSLFWASSIQSVPPHPTSWRAILILFSNLCLGLLSGLFPSGYPIKPCICVSSPPYALHATPISLFSIQLPEQYSVCSTDH
jgi:hypothetical protein